MLLDIANIEQIAKIFSPQELHAALAWHHRHQTFHEEASLTELHQPPQLWSSFFFMAPSDGVNWKAWRFDEVFKTLMKQAYKWPSTDAYGGCSPIVPAHCLYRYFGKQEKIVARMMLWESSDGRRPSLSLVPLSPKSAAHVETLDKERSTLLP